MEDGKKKEQHIQAAKDSGLFDLKTIDDVIASVLTMGSDSQSSQALALTKTLDVEGLAVFSINEGGKDLKDHVSVKKGGVLIHVVGRHTPEKVTAAAMAAKRGEPAEKK